MVEVACCTGYWTQCIAATATSVLGLDAAQETLQVARARGLGAHVQWALGDAYALPRAPSQFDAAFAGFWCSRVPRARLTTLRGLHAALPAGKRVALLDN